jgi:hypothetical protein
LSAYSFSPEGKGISEKLIDASVGALIRIYGNGILDDIELGKCTDETMEIIKDYRELYKETE